MALYRVTLKIPRPGGRFLDCPLDIEAPDQKTAEAKAVERAAGGAGLSAEVSSAIKLRD